MLIRISVLCNTLIHISDILFRITVSYCFIMKLLKRQFGKQLNKAIKARGLNQRMFAEMLGVEPPTVSRWVTGDISPEDSRVQDICRALGVTEEYFLESSDVMPEKSQKRMDAIAWELNLDIEDPADKEFFKKIIPILPELKKVPVEILDLLTKADSHTHAHILEELRLLNEPDPPTPKGTKKSKDLGR